MSETLELFADEQVELLPERTTMQAGFFQNGNLSIAVAVNAGNINFGGSQTNIAAALALAGSNVG